MIMCTQYKSMYVHVPPPPDQHHVEASTLPHPHVHSDKPYAVLSVQGVPHPPHKGPGSEATEQVKINKWKGQQFKQLGHVAPCSIRGIGSTATGVVKATHFFVLNIIKF